MAPVPITPTLMDCKAPITMKFYETPSYRTVWQKGAGENSSPQKLGASAFGRCPVTRQAVCAIQLFIAMLEIKLQAELKDARGIGTCGGDLAEQRTVECCRRAGQVGMDQAVKALAPERELHVLGHGEVAHDGPVKIVISRAEELVRPRVAVCSRTVLRERRRVQDNLPALPCQIRASDLVGPVDVHARERSVRSGRG